LAVVAGMKKTNDHAEVER